MTILSIIALLLAVATVILTSEHARRCGQIEHIIKNVKKTPKVANSLSFLNGARYRMRTIARYASVVAIYGSFILSAIAYAEAMDNLLYLTLGSAILTIASLLSLEGRIVSHRRTAKGGAV